MTINQKLYDRLANKVHGMQVRYQRFRKKHFGIKKITVPESSLSLLEEPEQLANRWKDIDVISIDVFDTLILRNVNSPRDVFYLVQKDYSCPDFRQIRRDAEKQTRLERSRVNGDYEVTFSEIWEKVHAVTGIDAREGMTSEWNAELACCYANPYFLELVRILKKQHKKMIICSDMYLGEVRIRELLSKCGYPEFDDYFISCDHRCSKSDGGLYDVIRRKYGESSSYIQIGDNKHSDIRQAKRKGFKTFHYHNVQEAGYVYRIEDMSPMVSSLYSGVLNGYLHNGLFQKTKDFEFGYIYGGLFMVGYCRSICEYIKDNSPEKILILEKDRDIIEKIYQILYPDETVKFEAVSSPQLATSIGFAAGSPERDLFSTEYDAAEVRSGIITFVQHFAKHPLSDVNISEKDASAPSGLFRKKNQ